MYNDHYLESGKKKLGDKNYESAIEDFEKSISIQPSFSSYIGLGIALYNISEYKKAVTALTLSTRLKETSTAYHYLGWSYLMTKKYNESIQFFLKSSTIGKNSRTFYGLALAFNAIKNYHKAIESLKQSLELKESQEIRILLIDACIYLRLYHNALEVINNSAEFSADWNLLKKKGKCLFFLNQFEEAKKSFLKSLEIHMESETLMLLSQCYSKLKQSEQAIKMLHYSVSLEEEWRNCARLGWEYLGIGNYVKSIKYFKKSIAFKPEGSSYRGLGQALKKSGSQDLALEAVEIDLGLSEPIAQINSFLSYDQHPINLSDLELTHVQKVCSEFGCEFHASKIIEKKTCLADWSNLMYLHIPKCAGSSFKIPFYMLFEELKKQTNMLESKGNTEHHLNTTSLLSSPLMLDALERYTAEKELSLLKSIFFTTAKSPPPKWFNSYSSISKYSNSPGRIIAITRNPRKRLYSHIKWEASHFNLDTMHERIASENSILNNTMYRFIYQYPFGVKSVEDIASSPANQFEFVDISDKKMLSSFKTAFLSSSCLPNIVQVEQMNDSSKNHSNLSDDEIQSLFNICVEKGFLDKDESIDLNSLHTSTRERHQSLLTNHGNNTGLHPLTFIATNNSNNQMDKAGGGYLVPTAELIDNPKKVLASKLIRK